MKSPITWVGIKQKLIQQILSVFPKEESINYFEPFAGSATMALNVHSSWQVTISDINQHLIGTYLKLQVHASEIIQILKSYECDTQEEEKAQFYLFRSQLRSSIDTNEDAAKFIFINKTCYRGLYRVNRSGGFNTPYGPRTRLFRVQEEELRRFSDRLLDFTIKNWNYTTLLAETEKDDLVYLDPPYETTFNQYHRDGFDQEKLRYWIEKTHQRGVRFVLSQGINFRFDLMKSIDDYHVYTLPTKHRAKPGGIR